MSKQGNVKRSRTEKLIELICRAAEAKKALDLKVLDVRKTSNIVDYMIICSGDSSPQLRAIEKEIDKSLRSNKIKGFRWQGLVGSGWLVLDLGAVVVHIMGVKERAYYDLEDLWGKEAVVYHY
ncbi:MAG: ribosome silencing factor [Candidatus Saganbacteria bacterium]|nr:ribosome silencing factor [Candidatus Saganbacteria bacterium]